MKQESIARVTSAMTVQAQSLVVVMQIKIMRLLFARTPVFQTGMSGHTGLCLYKDPTLDLSSMVAILKLFMILIFFIILDKELCIFICTEPFSLRSLSWLQLTEFLTSSTDTSSKESDNVLEDRVLVLGEILGGLLEINLVDLFALCISESPEELLRNMYTESQPQLTWDGTSVF